jgi:hypothetical protein
MLESAAADAESRKTRFQFAGTLPLAAAMGGAVLLARRFIRFRASSAYGRYAATRIGEGDIFTSARGGTRRSPSALSNGAQLSQRRKVQASSEPQDMRLQRMPGT